MSAPLPTCSPSLQCLAGRSGLNLLRKASVNSSSVFLWRGDWDRQAGPRCLWAERLWESLIGKDKNNVPISPGEERPCGSASCVGASPASVLKRKATKQLCWLQGGVSAPAIVSQEPSVSYIPFFEIYALFSSWDPFSLFLPPSPSHSVFLCLNLLYTCTHLFTLSLEIYYCSNQLVG